MWEKNYDDVESQEYALALGVLYAVSTLSVNAGFFSEIGFDFSYLFSASDIFIANVFVIQNAVLVWILISSLMFIYGVFSRIIIIRSFFESKYRLLSALFANFYHTLSTNDNLRYFFIIYVVFVLVLLTGFIPKKYFFPVMLANSLWLTPAIYEAWVHFRNGVYSFGQAILRVCIYVGFFFYVFGERWASSLILSDTPNIYVVKATDVCMPRMLLRSSENGVLFWSISGGYIEFVPWNLIKYLSTVPCVN